MRRTSTAALHRTAACIALSALAAAQYPVLVLQGEPSDQLGHALASGGDVNGDARVDLVIGARHADAGGTNAGAVIAISGAGGSELWRVDGADIGDNLGSAVAFAGDLDGDGMDEVIAGAPFAGTGAAPLSGEVRVLSGADGSLVHLLNGTIQFDLFGSAVHGGGPVDGDSIPDFLIGAPNEDGGGVDSGVVHIISGATGGVLYSLAGDQQGDLFGTAVLMIGDVDGDSREDFAVGAPMSDLAGIDAGLVRVYSGVNGMPLYTLLGTPGSEFGRSLALVGDLDGDTQADFAVGAWKDPTGGPEAGRVSLFSSIGGALLHEIDGSPGTRFGTSIAFAGEIDGTGPADFMVGAPGEGATGAVHVISGGSYNLFLHMIGAEALTGFGSALAGPLDLDADGLPEIVLGEPTASDGGPAAGRVTFISSVDPLGGGYCFGDGSGSICPCGNMSGNGEGCANSTGAGATLSGSGTPSVSEDDLEFAAAGLPPGQPALLFAGINATGGGDGLLFGDGLRCAGGSVVRLGAEIADSAGAALWGPGLIAHGGFPAGETRRFQVWYRDPLASPCGFDFNLSAAYQTLLAP